MEEKYLHHPEGFEKLKGKKSLEKNALSSVFEKYISNQINSHRMFRSSMLWNWKSLGIIKVDKISLHC